MKVLKKWPIANCIRIHKYNNLHGLFLFTTYIDESSAAGPGWAKVAVPGCVHMDMRVVVALVVTVSTNSFEYHDLDFESGTDQGRLHNIALAASQYCMLEIAKRRL